MIGLFLANLYFYPVKDLPVDQQVIFFNHLTPEFIKDALGFFGLGFLIVLPIYLSMRIYKRAIISFNLDSIDIVGEKVKLSFQVSSIQNVTFLDPHRLNGESVDKFYAVFLFDNDRVVRIRLEHYLQAEDFIDSILRYSSIKTNSYDFNVIADGFQEE